MGMRTDVDLAAIRETAEGYYQSGQFFCAEAVVRTLIDALALDMPDDAVKAVSGFAAGMGGMGCTCGAVVGGILTIGWVYGRSQPGDPRVFRAMDLTARLYRTFIERHRLTCCKVLTRGLKKGSPEHKCQCIGFTGEMAYETAKLLLEAEQTGEAEAAAPFIADDVGTQTSDG